MVENSSLITDPWQLQGKTIGIMSGSNTGPVLAIKLNEVGIIGDDVVSNDDAGTQYQGAYIKKVASYAELSQELEEGAVDAAAMDGAIAQGYMNDERSILDFDIAEQGVRRRHPEGLGALWPCHRGYPGHDRRRHHRCAHGQMGLRRADLCLETSR